MKKIVTTKQLENAVKSGKLSKHHKSYIRQYVSRKSGAYVLPYKGRFGEGYKLLDPNMGSTQYSFISYFVK